MNSPAEWEYTFHDGSTIKMEYGASKIYEQKRSEVADSIGAAGQVLPPDGCFVRVRWTTPGDPCQHESFFVRGEQG